MEDWEEIVQCQTNSRRELVLKGNDERRDKIKKSDGEVPLQLYDLNLLNFLELSWLGIKRLSIKIENLQNLTQLFLMKNELTELPDTICSIVGLKFLDVSENLIVSFPENMGKLVNLHTLNATNNQLSSLPSSVSNLPNLAVLFLSQNQFCEFPIDLYDEPVCLRLADINISNNKIDDVGDAIEKMTMLKNFDMSNNNISELTQAIGKCLKLKQAYFKGNSLKDKRLKKLIENNGSQKSILDYIRSKGRKITANGANAKKTQSKGARKKLKDDKVKSAAEEHQKDLIRYFLEVLKLEDEKGCTQPFRIIASDDVKEIRPFIVGCLIIHLNINSEKQFKSFITLQTKLHEEICQKRTIATIATHDAKLIPESVVHYDALDPTTFSIRPLGRRADVKALTFFRRLCKEADDARKEKKRNQVSGIHKYLNLLKDKEKFAYLRRKSDDCVISLPPLTNSDVTRISQDTSHVFVEVTGTKSLNSCKAVLDELLKKMVELGFHSRPPKEADFYDNSSDDSDEDKQEDEPKRLIVQQVRVENEQGDVKVIYPSRTDLCFESKEIKIVRS